MIKADFILYYSCIFVFLYFDPPNATIVGSTKKKLCNKKNCISGFFYERKKIWSTHFLPTTIHWVNNEVSQAFLGPLESRVTYKEY